MSEPTKKTSTRSTSKKIANIMLVKGFFHLEDMEKPLPNFIGIPMDADSPFVEIIWDPRKKVLGVVSKVTKEKFQFVPKLSSKGTPLPNNDKSTNQIAPYQQERLLIQTFHEYYISDQKEIDEFLKIYAFNTKFDWKNFTEAE
jgi:hypothetical protein